MSRKPTHAITDTDFGDTVELKVRLTQQQFHCLRSLTLDGLAQDFSEADWLLIRQLEPLGLIEIPEHNEEYIYPTGLYEAFRSHIIDYTEVFSKTSASVAADPASQEEDLFRDIPESTPLQLFYVPALAKNEPGEWRILNGLLSFPLPDTFSIDFFIRHGIFDFRRTGNVLYGTRFRDDVTYQLHVAQW